MEEVKTGTRRVEVERGEAQSGKAKSGQICCANFTMVMQLLLDPGYTK